MMYTAYEIILTNDCNLSCRYCYEHGQVDRGLSMTSGIRAQTIDYIVTTHDTTAAVIQIQFFGGEPTICFVEMQEMIAALEERLPGKCVYGITTNATLLTRTQIEYLAQKKINTLVSLDGGKLVHEPERGIGTFELLMSRLAMLRALAVPLELRMTVTPRTISQFMDSFWFVARMGVPFRWVLDTSEEYPVAALEDFVVQVREIYKYPHQDKTLESIRARISNKLYCIDPEKTISIAPDGTHRYCSAVLTAPKSRSEQCSTCISLPICQGGCLGAHPPNDKFCKVMHVLNVIYHEHVLKGLL